MNIKNVDEKYKLLVILLILLVLPFLGVNTYCLRVIIMVFIYTILALGLNIITGYTGQLSLGNASFFAIGAYISAIIVKNGVPFILGLVIAGVIAGIFGLLLGLPTLRLSGTYLAITTLGFGEIIRMVLLNWDSVTNGPLGISRIPKPNILGITFSLGNNGIYYLVLSIVKIYLIVCYKRLCNQMQCYRNIGYGLFLLNIPMGGMIILMIKTNAGYSYPGYIIYLSALYTFYTVIVAVINLVKFHKTGNLILSANKIINFVCALMSILALQTAMISRFSSHGDSYRQMMNTITGVIVYVLVIMTAFYMIIHSKKGKKVYE